MCDSSSRPTSLRKGPWSGYWEIRGRSLSMEKFWRDES